MAQPLVGKFPYDRVKGKPVSRPEMTALEKSYVTEVVKGLGITTGHFFRNTKAMLRGERPDAVTDPLAEGVTTLDYPEQKKVYPERFRGVHRLTLRDDGSPRCVACLCCSTACPAQCIYIEAGEYEADDGSPESRVIEKYPRQFVIDELRCIVCGLCVDACPKDAIRMDTYTHTPSEYSRQGFVYDIPRLLKGPPASHPSDPWFKRGSSEAPDHQHKEAHTRILGGGSALARSGPALVEVVKFPKPAAS